MKIDYQKLSPNHSGKRTHVIDRITPHCVVGQLSVEQLGEIFHNPKRKASCQYGIGSDGRIGQYLEEEKRSWCSSSNENDQRAITIECASDTKPPYAFKDVVYEKLIELCVDICRRYNKTKLLWLADRAKAIAYKPNYGEMILTVHRWFAAKSCPGDWLYSRMGDLASKVTRQLNYFYRVRKSWEDINSQIGAFTSLENAKATAALHEGYFVFDENGEKIA